jgi:hypothetical protein
LKGSGRTLVGNPTIKRPLGAPRHPQERSGIQCTGHVVTGLLKSDKIKISADGKMRFRDNGLRRIVTSRFIHSRRPPDAKC